MINNRNLVLCTGMPEYLYAKSLQMDLPRHVQNSVSVVQAIHQANNPLELMLEAIDRKRQSVKNRDPYKMVCVLLNRPDCSDDKVRMLLENQNLTLAYCPVCIEQWYMLHFEEYDPSIRCQFETVSKLRALWPEYRKNGIDAYSELKDRLHLAVERAESATDSHFELYKDNAPVFTMQRLLRFFTTLKDAA